MYVAAWIPRKTQAPLISASEIVATPEKARMCAMTYDYDHEVVSIGQITVLEGRPPEQNRSGRSRESHESHLKKGRNEGEQDAERHADASALGPLGVALVPTHPSHPNLREQDCMQFIVLVTCR